MRVPEASQSLASFHRLFHHEKQYKIVICKEHGCACTYSSVKSHLQKQHPEIPAAARRGIIEDACPTIEPWVRTVFELCLPERDRDGALPQPIPYLPIDKAGQACNNCSFITLSLSTINTHQADTHARPNPNPAGRPSHGAATIDGQPWQTGVWSQKFMSTGDGGHRFAVAPEEAAYSRDVVPALQNNAALDLVEEAFASFVTSEHERQLQVIDDEEQRFETTPWGQQTGWVKHFQGLDRTWLLQLTTPQEYDKPELKLLLQLTKSLIWKAQRVCQSSEVGNAALTYVNRRETGSDTNEKPLNPRQGSKTMKNYAGYWMGIIRYIWLTYTLPAHRNGGQTRTRKPPYKLTDTQTRHLLALDAALESAAAHTESEEEACENSQRRTGAEDGEDSDLNDTSDAVEEDDGHDDADEGEETDMEEERPEQLLGPEDVQVQRLETLVLHFIISLLDHNVGDTHYNSALLSGMAALGISKHAWLQPGSYTTKQSGIVTVSKMMVVYYAYCRRKSEIERLQLEDHLGYNEASDVAPTQFSTVRGLVDKFMTLLHEGADPTPIDFILRLRAYGLGIQRATNIAGTCNWAGDQLTYGRDVMFTMPAFKEAIRSMVYEARTHLYEKLMFLQLDEHKQRCVAGTAPLPIVQWSRLADNPADKRLGFSFMEDPRNAKLGGVPDPRKWLAGRVREDPHIRRLLLNVTPDSTSGTASPYKRTAVAQLVRDVYAFKKLLLILVWYTGGLPGRGTEMLTMQYQNSARGERGILIENGLVVGVTRYHKGQGSSRQQKVIHRYLPREVGELLVYYLWFVQPFVHLLEWYACEDPARRIVLAGLVTAYIWPPKPEQKWEKPRVQLHQREGSKRMRIQSQPSRQPSAVEKAGIIDSIQYWTTQLISTSMKRLTSEHLGCAISIAPYRQISLFLFERHTTDRAAARIWAEAEKDDEHVEDEAHDLQMTHTTKTAHGHYGRGATEASYSTEARRQAFRRVSTEWHRVIGMPSAVQSGRFVYAETALALQAGLYAAVSRFQAMSGVSLSSALAHLFGPDALFRGKQEEALEAIQIQRRNPIVVVMGTAAGKSLLFMLPASVSTGVTVVVVPLISLRDDMMRRCKDLRIPSVAWSPKRPNIDAKIVLVTPEVSDSANFRTYLNGIRAEGRLDRVVVDEAHLVVESERGDWRPAYLRLHELFYQGVQMVFLTATLPPTIQPLFASLYKLPKSIYWIRDTTVRINHAYSWVKHQDKDRTKALQSVARKIMDKHKGQGQVIVFTPTVSLCKEAAECLSCPAYYASVGSAETKFNLAKSLLSGTEAIFAATSAWGLGIDAPSVRAIIWYGPPRSTVEWAQAAGRAGRDGRRSELVIMQRAAPSDTGSGKLVPLFENGTEPQLRRIVSGKECVRVILGQYMDGDSSRRGCRDCEQRCQVCEAESRKDRGAEEAAEQNPRRRLLPEQPAELVESVVAYQEDEQRQLAPSREMRLNRQTAAADVKYCLDVLERWNASLDCLVCTIRRMEHVSTEVTRCRQVESEAAKTWWSKSVRPRTSAYSCCARCGLPQALCEHWEEEEDGGHTRQPLRSCQINEDFLGLVLYWLWQTRVKVVAGGRPAAETAKGLGEVARSLTGGQFSGTWPVDEGGLVWLTKKIRYGEVECSNAFYFVVRLTRMWRDGKRVCV